jgi:hypothetical protein
MTLIGYGIYFATRLETRRSRYSSFGMELAGDRANAESLATRLSVATIIATE